MKEIMNEEQEEKETLGADLHRLTMVLDGAVRSDTSNFRKQAEDKAAASPDDVKHLSPNANDTRLMAYELRVHQIELEMQNEELLRALAELDAVRRSYFDLYDLAPVGYLTLSETGLILEANRCAATLLGVIRGMLVGQPVSRFLLKEDEAAYCLFREKLIATGKPQTCEFRMVKSDSSFFWAQMSATVAQKADGTPVCRLVLVDITERKRAAEALHASEIQLQGILESTADGILAVDNEGKVIKANHRFAELWRVPESLIESRDDKALLTFVLEQLSAPQTFLKKVQSLYKSDVADIDTISFKDGRIFERYSIPLLMAGSISGRVWSFRDITTHKQVEEAVNKLTKTKTKFTSVVSHELRSPLATIKEATNLVLEGVLGPVNAEQKDMLNTAKSNIDRLSRLVNDVLTYQKMDTGKMRYDIHENDVNEVVKEACKSVRLFAGERKADLVVEFGTDLPRLKCDKDKIVEVLINLMSNGLKYSERGPVVTKTRLGQAEIQFSVQDSGQGIDPEDMDEIYNPFSHSKGRKIGGTGLGLAISKEIVLAHHGRIWAESEIGKGSTFYFTLPIGQV
jgi:PAS domain S-box-containing protein